MPLDGSREELSFPQKRISDGLDEVAKGLAAGTISRRRVLKLTGSALLGSGLLALFPGVAGADSDPECQGEPAINNVSCPENVCSENPNCVCARTVGGDKKCVDLGLANCPASDECDSNRDCASGEVCIRVGGCCGHARRNLCAPKCGPRV